MNTRRLWVCVHMVVRLNDKTGSSEIILLNCLTGDAGTQLRKNTKLCSRCKSYKDYIMSLCAYMRGRRWLQSFTLQKRNTDRLLGCLAHQVLFACIFNIYTFFAQLCSTLYETGAYSTSCVMFVHTSLGFSL